MFLSVGVRLIGDEEPPQELTVQVWVGSFFVSPTRKRGRLGDPFNSFIPKTAVLPPDADCKPRSRFLKVRFFAWACFLTLP